MPNQLHYESRPLVKQMNNKRQEAQKNSLKKIKMRNQDKNLKEVHKWSRWWLTNLKSNWLKRIN